MSGFKLVSKFKPAGDQPQAIKKLVSGFKTDDKQVLVGVTGSGKTFTMAHVIAKMNLPTLVVSHNKTLAAQLYNELSEFFPKNAVEYFVSYYDYYQPEAYVPHTDVYIEKDAAVNDDLDRLRLAATGSLLSRKDAIIVSSVSCIYGLGAPEDWMGLLVEVEVGQMMPRDELLKKLIFIQYERAERALERGMFRVRGDIVEVYPSYKRAPTRIEFKAGKVIKISQLEADSHAVIRQEPKVVLYPAKHFVTPSERLKKGIVAIEDELGERYRELESQGKQLEAKRLLSRTRYDLEMLQEVGYCSGVENYSRHLSGREAGEKPYTLLDYFQKPFLLIMDESHVTLPQFRGMFNGDRARKQVLVDHGFRLPSALDNRPLKFDEFEASITKCLYVSATPSVYELEQSTKVAEQLVRPTGILDPRIEVRPSEGQIDDLIKEIRVRAEKNERTLVTTLTKRMAEDLSRYLKEVGIKVSYLHSEFDALERAAILKDLRLKKYDCIVGINLLREGLDLPEVSLVVILDADKEGFLRSETSLIQTAGRAARNLEGKVIMYADRVTDSMQTAIRETKRRRKLQEAFNQQQGIVPRAIKKAILQGLESVREAEELVLDAAGETRQEHASKTYLDYLRTRMERSARALDFERAARLRDEIRKLEGGTAAALSGSDPGRGFRAKIKRKPRRRS